MFKISAGFFSGGVPYEGTFQADRIEVGSTARINKTE